MSQLLRDLTEIKQFAVRVLLPRDASEEQTIFECRKAAMELGEAIGAKIDWYLISDPEADGDQTYELRVVALDMEQLIALIDKCVSQGIQLAAEGLAEYAEGLVPSSREIVEAAAEALANKQ